MRTTWLFPILAAMVFSAYGDELVRESKQTEEKAPAKWTFNLDKHPSLRWGKLFRIDFRAKVQNDFRTFEPDVATDEGLYELHRARVGIEGRLLKTVEFEVERELAATQNPWKDVFINWRHFRHVQIKAGKFKAPFGMEQLVGPTQTDFIYRAGISEYLVPGRDIGVMAHGRFFDRGLNFAAGLFRHDGDNARIKNNERAAGQTFVARLTGVPFRLTTLPSVFKDLELGGAFTIGEVEEGSNSLRGRTVAKKYIFRRLDVNGRRLRLGTEMKWKHGPFGINGEYIQVSDERRGQGLLGEDLSDLVSRGWYLSGVWTVFDRTEGSRAKHQSFVKSVYETDGIGAVQLAVRYEQLRFGSVEHIGTPSRDSRAANILGNSNRALTFGANWMLNRHTRIQVNAMREKIEDIQRSPIPGREHFWTRLCRLQFVL
jgi:phosphate-selective porin OprO/OprP